MRPITEQRRVRMSRRAWPVLVVAALVACTTALLGRPAGAANPAGTVTVTVDRDYVGDGNYHAPSAGQAGDVAQPGMTVTVTDVNGKTVHKTTDASGSVTITASDGLTAPYRVDVSIPAPYSNYLGFAPAKSGGTFDPATSFVDPSNGKDVALRVAVWDPADYGQRNADLVIPAESSYGPAQGALGTSTDALVTRPNAATGTQTVIATQQQIGDTFGVAYDRPSHRVFTSAFAKAYTEYGPGGAGAIYVTDLNSATPNGSLFTTVHDVNPSNITQHVQPLNTDYAYYPVPGTQSLGGLTMSDDGTTLYTVNLADQKLISVDVADPSSQTATPIPDPGCTGGRWRPFGTAEHDNTLYVGGVCDASSTTGSDAQRRANLKAVVYAYRSGTFTLVLQHSLDFLRGSANGNNVTATANADVDTHWNAWTDSFSPANFSVQPPVGQGPYYVDRPEPELATMAFDRDGSLILGFRDRSGDQLGNAAPVRQSDGNVIRPVNVITGADINRVCNFGGTYVWEGESSGANSCPNNNTGTNSGGEPTGASPTGVQEFYPGDVSINKQREAAHGSVVLPVGSSTVTSTELDPRSTLYTDGLGFYDVDAAAGLDPAADPTARSVIVEDGNVTNGTGFGKANGLGAITLLAAAAPAQIGNRVWLDSNRNGVQDAGELSLSHAKVTLLSGGTPVLDQNGQPVVAFTDSNGAYYFGGPASTYQLVPGQPYTVQFDVSTVTNLPTGVSTSTLRYTATKAGGDDRHDSNAVTVSGKPQVGTAAVPALSVGDVDHTIDAGVYSPSIPVPPPGGTPPASPPPGTATPPGSGQPPGTTTFTTVLINTGRPAAPHNGNPWSVAAGVAALGAAGLVMAVALRRRRRAAG